MNVCTLSVYSTRVPETTGNSFPQTEKVAEGISRALSDTSPLEAGGETFKAWAWDVL
jgi:hypothetical protein